jgi:hypothetical protein
LGGITNKVKTGPLVLLSTQGLAAIPAEAQPGEEGMADCEAR